MRDPATPVCRTISTLLQRIGDKWTVLVVSTLGEGPRRFNELRREMRDAGKKRLEKSGFADVIIQGSATDQLFVYEEVKKVDPTITVIAKIVTTARTQAFRASAVPGVTHTSCAIANDGEST